MTVIDDHGRPEAPINGDEVASLLGFLDFQRATLGWKCAGLDAAGLSATTAASTMTLGGILKHMTLVEHSWFGEELLGLPPLPGFAGVDWEADRDWDWRTAAADAPDELRSNWEAAVTAARGFVAEALAGGGLDGLAAKGWPDGRTPSLRWIVLHMIEEYARHNGHADLFRESVDGAAGE